MRFLGAFTKLRKATVSFVMSFLLSDWINSGFTGRIFMKFDIVSICGKYVEKIKVSLNQTRITGTLHVDQCTFLIISSSILLRMKNVSDKSCREL